MISVLPGKQKRRPDESGRRLKAAESFCSRHMPRTSTGGTRPPVRHLGFLQARLPGPESHRFRTAPDVWVKVTSTAGCRHCAGYHSTHRGITVEHRRRHRPCHEVTPDTGQGVVKDEEEAAKWFRKAADQGYAPAQYNLGGMYTKGNGVANASATRSRDSDNVNPGWNGRSARCPPHFQSNIPSALRSFPSFGD